MPDSPDYLTVLCIVALDTNKGKELSTFFRRGARPHTATSAGAELVPAHLLLLGAKRGNLTSGTLDLPP